MKMKMYNQILKILNRRLLNHNQKSKRKIKYFSQLHMVMMIMMRQDHQIDQEIDQEMTQITADQEITVDQEIIIIISQYNNQKTIIKLITHIKLKNHI